MDKIILKDKTELEFNKIEGLNITFVDKNIEELENRLTKENCSKVQLVTSVGEVYGVYNNLECTSIVKNIKDSSITVNLKELDNTVVRINDLEGAVADLGAVVSELSEGGAK